jgi:hypothetical protein
VVSSIQVFQTNILYHFSFLPCTLRAPPIWSSLIWCLPVRLQYAVFGVFREMIPTELKCVSQSSFLSHLLPVSLRLPYCKSRCSGWHTFLFGRSSVVQISIQKHSYRDRGFPSFIFSLITQVLE